MSDELKYNYLKGHPLFQDIDELRIRSAAEMSRLKTAVRGEIFDYGTVGSGKLYLLIRGKIKLTESDRMDNDMIKDILTAPDLFGDLGLDSNPNPDEFAEALTANTVVCVFSTAGFKTIMAASPILALAYAHTVNNKLKNLERRHADLVFRDTRSRLIHFIKNWARSDGSLIGNKIVLNNYLTHSDIAGVIATSRQSVNVLLNELRDDGMLYYNRKKIELNDPFAWN